MNERNHLPFASIYDHYNTIVIQFQFHVSQTKQPNRNIRFENVLCWMQTLFHSNLQKFEKHKLNTEGKIRIFYKLIKYYMYFESFCMTLTHNVHTKQYTPRFVLYLLNSRSYFVQLSSGSMTCVLINFLPFFSLLI